MSISNGFKDYVLDQLNGLDLLASKRMFGGVGIWQDGYFFAILYEDRLYFKVDETNLRDYTACSAKPFRVTFRTPKRKSITMGYYEVPVEVLESAVTLKSWAEKSIAVVRKREVAQSRGGRKRIIK